MILHDDDCDDDDDFLITATATHCTVCTMIHD